MIEIYGDMWEKKADAKCITTNGFTRKDGRAVMGRGVALQATKRYPEIADFLGQALRSHGNHVQMLGWTADDGWLLSFPVKHKWWEKADLGLIYQSTQELVKVADREDFKTILLPRPGCGNGGLYWDDVKPAIDGYLDDRFLIIEYRRARDG